MSKTEAKTTKAKGSGDSKMGTEQKMLRLPVTLCEAIVLLAYLENRSFTGQAVQLLEEAVATRQARAK